MSCRDPLGVLDMSGPYRKTFDDSLPDAIQVADPFHVLRHANSKLDECRRRVQNETLGHRGRKADPLYRSRRLLTSGHERLASNGETRLLSLLEAGDPHGEVRMTWHAKETVRRFYDIDDPDVAAAYLDELVGDMLLAASAALAMSSAAALLSSATAGAAPVSLFSSSTPGVSSSAATVPTGICPVTTAPSAPVSAGPSAPMAVIARPRFTG
jgi:transposase